MKVVRTWGFTAVKVLKHLENHVPSERVSVKHCQIILKSL